MADPGQGSSSSNSNKGNPQRSWTASRGVAHGFRNFCITNDHPDGIVFCEPENISTGFGASTSAQVAPTEQASPQAHDIPVTGSAVPPREPSPVIISSSDESPPPPPGSPVISDGGTITLTSSSDEREEQEVFRQYLLRKAQRKLERKKNKGSDKVPTTPRGSAEKDGGGIWNTLRRAGTSASLKESGNIQEGVIPPQVATSSQNVANPSTSSRGTTAPPRITKGLATSSRSTPCRVAPPTTAVKQVTPLQGRRLNIDALLSTEDYSVPPPPTTDNVAPSAAAANQITPPQPLATPRRMATPRTRANRVAPPPGNQISSSAPSPGAVAPKNDAPSGDEDVPQFVHHKKFNYKSRATAAAPRSSSVIKLAPSASATSSSNSTSVLKSLLDAPPINIAKKDPQPVRLNVDDLRLSPYITREQAELRLQAIGNLEETQREIDAFAAIVCTGSMFRMNMTGGNTDNPSHLATQNPRTLPTMMASSSAAAARSSVITTTASIALGSGGDVVCVANSSSGGGGSGEDKSKKEDNSKSGGGGGGYFQVTSPGQASVSDDYEWISD